MFPRGMNNKEKAMLATIKEYGFAYELKFFNGVYWANIPILKECWCLSTDLTENRRKYIHWIKLKTDANKKRK